MSQTRLATTLLLVLLMTHPIFSFMELSDENLTQFKYKDLTKLAQELQSFEDYVKVHDLSKKYPNVPEADCKDKDCLNYLFEVYNFGRHKKNFDNIPTILIVSGMSGLDTNGINSIFHFLRSLPHVFKIDDNWNRNINNVRFLFMPIANPSGYIYKTDNEILLESSDQMGVNPMFDFNWGKTEGQCFQTSTAQYLHYIFSDNLIMGTLILSNGDSKVLYPNRPNSGAEFSESNDADMLKIIAETLNEAGNNNLNFHKNNKKYSVDMLPANQAYKEKQQSGSFVMWAYAGSRFHENLSQECFKDQTDFAINYKNPGQFHLSSLTFQIDLSSKLDYDPEELGNQTAIVFPKSDNSVSGIVSQTINFIQQFSEVIRPFFKISNIKIEDNEKVKLILYFKGCREIGDIKIIEPKDIDFEMEKTNDRIEKVTYVIKYNLSFFISDFKQLIQEKNKSLKFNLTCNQNFSLGDDEENQTLFGLLKGNNKNYSSQYGVTLPNLHLMDSTINNLDLSVLLDDEDFEERYSRDDMFLFHTRTYKMINIIQEPIIALQIGPFSPFLFYYKKKTRSMHLELETLNLPSEYVIDDDNTDMTPLLELGIGSRMSDMILSKQLIITLREFQNKWKDTHINIFRPKPSIYPDDSYEISSAPSIKNVDSQTNLMKKSESFYNLKQFDFYTESFKFEKTEFMNMNWFINHIHDEAKIKMELQLGNPLDLEAKKDPKFLALQNIMYHNELYGKIKLYDSKLISRNSDTYAEGLVTDGEFKMMEPENGIYIRGKETYCSSMNTTIRPNFIDDSKRKKINMTVNTDVKRYLRENLDYYGLKVYRFPQDIENGKIELVVGATNLEKQYLLRYRSKIFELNPSGKVLDVIDPQTSHVSQLHIFEYEGAMIEFNFGGRLLKLYDESDTNLLLDCQLIWQSGLLDFKEEYDEYNNSVNIALKDLGLTRKDLLLPDPEEFKGLQNNRDYENLNSSALEKILIFVFAMLLF